MISGVGAFASYLRLAGACAGYHTLSISEGWVLYVARLTPTVAIAQAIAPGTVGPRSNGVPRSFHPTHTTKPDVMPAIIPGFVAFFQNSAANAGIPAAAA